MIQLDIPDPPEGWTILEWTVCTKMLDEAGEMSFGTFRTDGLGTPETIGMLHLAIAEQTQRWVDSD